MTNWLRGPWQVCADDRETLRKLGTKHSVISESFKELEHAKPTLIATIWLTYGGEIDQDSAAKIELYITAMPAMFYTAKIVKAVKGDGTNCEASTGSGRLDQYMPMFLAIAEGMLVIKA